MAHQIYKTSTGLRVASVTTKLGKFKDPGALQGWAAKMASEGKDFREEMKKAGRIGTVVHEAIHAICWGTEGDGQKILEESDLPHESRQPAQIALGAFTSWWGRYKIEPICSEVQLVSDEHLFGGTPDMIGRLEDGTLVMVDWKTGGGIYSDMIAQVAAYVHLWEWGGINYDFPIEARYETAFEDDGCFGDHLAEAHILRFSKESGSMTHKQFPRSVIDEGWRYFSAISAAYEIGKYLAKECR